MSLKDVLLDQYHYELSYILKKPYTTRLVSPLVFGNSLIKVIMGPRRSGKSYYAIHIMHEQGHFAYVNFEDNRIVKNLSPELLLQALDEIYGKYLFIFMDEIQNLEKWEEYVLLYQRRGINVIISGSNSQLLESEVATKLTGRYSLLILFPFNFAEYLNAKAISRLQTTLEMQNHVKKYLENGGFPAVIVENIDIYKYFRDLFDSIILKDIRNRYQIRKPGLLEDFSFYLITNNTQELSFNNVANKLQTTPDTLITYFGYLQEAFLFFAIPRFSFKIHEQLVYNKKVYAIDTGLAHYNGFRFSENEEKLYENIVAIVLYYLSLQGKLSLFYWRDTSNHEIDFVIKQNASIIALIQVSLSMKTEKTKNRELRSLVSGSLALNCDNLILITHDLDKNEKYTWNDVTKEISCISLWNWLLLEDLQKFHLN